jgi:hypothetical protein
MAVPNTGILTNSDGSLSVISEKVEGTRSGPGRDDATAAAAKGFGVDALVSNWDVHGASGDNVLWSGGKPIRVDLGGAMAFRAQGGAKPSFSASSPWGEPESMRTSPQGKAFYGDMTDKQVADSLRTAAGIDVTQVGKDWVAQGVPPALASRWAETLEARQKQIPDLVAGLTKKDVVVSGGARAERVAAIMAGTGWGSGVAARAAFAAEWTPALLARISTGSPEKQKDEIESRLRELMGRATVKIRMPATKLDKFLKDGQFKNQFKTGTSRGTLDPAYRAKAEAKMFGIPAESRDGDDHPVYGYVSTATHPTEEGIVSHYGEIVFSLRKSDVFDRTTFTTTDSLGCSVLPTPIANPGWESLVGTYGRSRVTLPTGLTEGSGASGSYDEAQIHGDVNLSHVEAVTIPPEVRVTAEAIAKMERAGVKVIRAKTGSSRW